MKTKIMAFIVLMGAGFIIFGCTGSPSTVDRSGNVQPVLQATTGTSNTGVSALDYESKAFIPTYNLDGSITLFTHNNFQIKIMPLTDGRTRGALNRNTNEFSALIAKYTGALEANPKDYDACIMLAGLYLDRGMPGDAELAVKYSDQALTISKDDPQALYARGLAYSEKGDNAKALNDLTAVLMSNIQSMKGVYYVMGMIQYKEGKIDEAIASFEKVKAIDPEFVDIDEVLEQLNKLTP